MKLKKIIYLPLFMILFPFFCQAETSLLVERECKRIANKLASVGYRECIDRKLSASDGKSVRQSPLLLRDYFFQQTNARVLLVGGIHGDEYSTVTIIFKWMKLLENSKTGQTNWQVIPLLNPDGLLQDKSQRNNANGRDLNNSFSQNGNNTLAETPEIAWLISLIDSFQPDAIISVHAPHEITDYDSLETGQYNLQKLSVSNVGADENSFQQYAASAGIPLLTVELPYADIMPTTTEISAIWNDIQQWIEGNTEKN